jgi:hypothetical protein
MKKIVLFDKPVCPAASRAFAANKAPLPPQKNTLRTRHCEERSNPGKLTGLDCFLLRSSQFAMTAVQPRHCEAQSSLSLCYRQWIASFVAMTVRNAVIKQHKRTVNTTDLLIPTCPLDVSPVVSGRRPAGKTARPGQGRHVGRKGNTGNTTRPGQGRNVVGRALFRAGQDRRMDTAPACVCRALFFVHIPSQPGRVMMLRAVFYQHSVPAGTG